MTATKLFAFDLPRAGPHLGALAARVYRLVPSARAEPIALAPDLVGASAGTDAEEGPFDDSNAGALQKPFTDVLVRGSAHTRGRGARRLDTGIELGAARKLVRAIGDRKLRVGPEGRLDMTEPDSFERLAITWSHAYGGRDVEAEARTAKPKPRRGAPTEAMDEDLGAISYPRNRWGRGFFMDLDRPRLEGSPLPNLEDPADPVTPDRLLARDAYDWIDRPAAACYLPADVLTFPRAAFFILPHYDAPTRGIYELSIGALSRDDLVSRSLFSPRDPRLFNAAPAGLGGCRLEGAERLKLWNLHPRQESFECDLPADRPRFLIEPPGCPARDLESLLQTVLIEPDEDRMTLTWAARMPTAVEFPEEALERVRHAVVWSR